jgi:Tfp pilus assembly protein PilX
MLNRFLLPRRSRAIPAPRQQGVILIVALLVLVAMTLAAIGLMRSVLTGNRVAGNLAFQQSAAQQSSIGVETAIAWLQANNTGSTLYTSIPIDGTHPVAYAANRQDPAPATKQSWDDFWTNQLTPLGLVNTLATDATTGNTIAYVIQRLCMKPGSPESGAECSLGPAGGSSGGNSKGSGVISLFDTGQSYYRITVRVSGPRSTVSFVQAIVKM